MLSKELKAGDIIFLEGDLGVGKTFISQIIINNLISNNLISSPTFNIVHTYKFLNDIEIWHCDFYRIFESNEIEELGVFDNINKKIILIEWPKFLDNFSLNPLKIKIEFGKTKDERYISFFFRDNWKNRLNFLSI